MPTWSSPRRAGLWPLALFACLRCASKVDVDRGPAPPIAYVADEAWPRLPPGRTLGQVSGVALDARGRVYVFHRAGAGFDNDTVIAAPTVMVIDGESGELLAEWGAGRFVTPHGISIDANDHVWLTDTTLDQVVEATTAGEVLHVYDGR
jgi:DNA-binding beta-propeller fold protein YncE